MAGKVLVRSAIGVAVLVAAYAAAGYVGVPRAVHWAVESYLPTVLGEADVRIGDVSFNPWSWELRIKDIQARSKVQPQDQSLSLASLYINLNSATLFTLSPVADALQIDGLNAHFSDVLLADAAAATNASTPPKKSADNMGKLPAFAFSNISLTNSNLTFVNSKNAARAEITDINFVLPVLSTMDNEGALSPVTPKLSLKVNGTVVQTTAKATEQGGEVKLHVNDLDVAQVLRALPLHLPYVAKSAKVSVDSTVTFQLAQKGLPHVQATGSATLSDISIVQEKGLPFFAAQTITAQWTNFVFYGPEIQKGSLTVAAGNIDLRNDKGSALFNAQNIAAAADGIAWKNASVSTTASAASATDAQIFDKSTDKQLASVQKINVSAAGFSFVKDQARIHDLKVAAQALRADPPQEALGETAAQTLSVSAQNIQSQKENILISGALLQTQHFTVNNRDGSPLAAVGSIEANLENFDLSKHSVVLGEVSIRQPQLRYVKKTAEHAKTFRSKVKETTANEKQSPWQYTLQSAIVDNGSVDFLDESIRPAGNLRVAGIRAELKNLQSKAGEARYSIAATLASGSIASTGTLAVAPIIKAQGATEISHIDLSAFNPWLTALSNTRFAKGTVDSAGELHLAQTQPLKLSWEGNAQIHHLDVRHASSGVQYVGWNDAQASDIRVTSVSPVAVNIGKLQVMGLTQKNINQVKQAANILGFIGALTGNKKFSSSANSALIDSITLNNISYGPSGFKLGGSIGNGLESLLLGNLNSFLTKLPR